MYNKTDVKTKRKLVGRYQAGESVDKICHESGISRSTMYYWTKLHRVQTTGSGVIVTSRELYSAKRQIKKYEDIIRVLKTVDCTVSSPLRSKLKALELLYGEYSVHVLCEALDVPRGTFYNHILRSKGDNSWFMKRRTELMDSIQTIYNDSNQVFGVGKVRAVLANQGYVVSEKIVAELMREMGLYSVGISAKKANRSLGWNERRTNLLKREFDVDRPDKVWASDVTFFKLKDRHYYICIFIDLFSRKILAISVGRNNSTHLVETAFMNAYAARQLKELIIHTDRGSVYTSYSMQKILKQNNVAHSLSQVGKPYDNAVAESFFATLKKEELYRVMYKSEAELRSSLTKYIDFYNATRPHQYLGYRTPDQAEVEFRQSKKIPELKTSEVGGSKSNFSDFLSRVLVFFHSNKIKRRSVNLDDSKLFVQIAYMIPFGDRTGNRTRIARMKTWCPNR